MTRMCGLVSLVSLFLTAGAFRVGQTPASAGAGGAPPPPCQCYECQTIHALWKGSPISVVAYYVSGTTNTTTIALYDVFTPGQNEMKPMVAPPGPVALVDELTFGSCNPMCGKSVPSRGGPPTWQWHQQVAETGPPLSPVPIVTNPRMVCTPSTTGSGVLSSDQKNYNNDGNSPP